MYSEYPSRQIMPSEHSKFITRFQVFKMVLLKIQVCWDVTLCHWTSSCWRFEESSPFIFRVKQSDKTGLLDLADEGTRAFQTFGTAHPTTRRHIPEDWTFFMNPVLWHTVSNYHYYQPQKKEIQN
jgi:hypothetical protein